MATTPKKFTEQEAKQYGFGSAEELNEVLSAMEERFNQIFTKENDNERVVINSTKEG